jgi:uncharacterized protein
LFWIRDEVFFFHTLQAEGRETMLSEMTQKKYDRLVEILRSMGSVAIGYSGGVDSTLLLKVAVDTLGMRAVAMIGRSETYPTREFEEALSVASAIGVRSIVVLTEETDDLKFRENPADRCYYCKTELFGKLDEIARAEGLRWIADGTIADDTGDFRPGMKAKAEKAVRSPLLEAGLGKAEVREISKHLALPTWDKPSFACLSSRFPYGTAITRENLARVDQAETFLRDKGFRVFRVRFHDENTARIEVSAAELPRLLDPGLREGIVDMMKNLGFIYVTLDLQGYRTGSMNEVLSRETQSRYAVRSGKGDTTVVGSGTGHP